MSVYYRRVRPEWAGFSSDKQEFLRRLAAGEDEGEGEGREVGAAAGEEGIDIGERLFAAGGESRKPVRKSKKVVSKTFPVLYFFSWSTKLLLLFVHRAAPLLRSCPTLSALTLGAPSSGSASYHPWRGASATGRGTRVCYPKRFFHNILTNLIKSDRFRRVYSRVEFLVGEGMAVTDSRRSFWEGAFAELFSHAIDAEDSSMLEDLLTLAHLSDPPKLPWPSGGLYPKKNDQAN